MDIRERIQAVIDRNPELSLRKVSLAAGLSDSMLHKFMKGSTRSLTLETVDKLARALDVDAVWLAYGEGDPERAGEIDALLKRIPDDQREQAMRVLEAFVKAA